MGVNPALPPWPIVPDECREERKTPTQGFAGTLTGVGFSNGQPLRSTGCVEVEPGLTDTCVHASVCTWMYHYLGLHPSRKPPTDPHDRGPPHPQFLDHVRVPCRIARMLGVFWKVGRTRNEDTGRRTYASGCPSVRRWGSTLKPARVAKTLGYYVMLHAHRKPPPLPGFYISAKTGIPRRLTRADSRPLREGPAK